MSWIAHPPYAYACASMSWASVASGKCASSKGRMESFHARSINSSCVKTEYAQALAELNVIASRTVTPQIHDRNHAVMIAPGCVLTKPHQRKCHHNQRSDNCPLRKASYTKLQPYRMSSNCGHRIFTVLLRVSLYRFC